MVADADRQPVYEAGPWEIDLASHELRLRGAPVILGGRAFEILATLVRSAGGLVTKDDIMSSVWPGAVVEENRLQVHISAIRKALGRDRVMLKTASGRGYRLVGEWTPRQESTKIVTPEPDRAEGGTTNLPVAAAGLIGREAAVHHLRDLLSAHRAVTLTGPGGIGKTALALEVARSLMEDFGNDCWLVDLASLSDPGLVSSAVAGVLGLQPGGEISAWSVARTIGGRRLLLVLDNCEHVIETAAELAETVLRKCSGCCIIATSREVLRIDGERVYRVAPLEVPPPGGEDESTILGRSAVQLFAARTRALNAELPLEADQLSAVAAICRRLDGIPLAIEFAAARASTLGISEIAARLDDRFALLTGGRRTALPRHQTLHAALDWSYQLLSDVERRLLHRLSIFAGSFTLDAAVALMHDDDGADAAVVLDSIANLVAKSLVTVDGPGLGPRWRLLETIRAFGLEKLRETGELDGAAWRQAEYCLQLFGRSEADWETRPLPDWLDIYGRQIDNLRAALDWAFSPAGDKSLGIALTIAAAPLLFQLSLSDECHGRVEQAFASLVDADGVTHERMRLLAISSWRVLESGNAHFAERAGILLRLLGLARKLGDLDHQALALWGLWGTDVVLGKMERAVERAEDFRETAVLSGDPGYLGESDRMFATLAFNAGEIARARASLDHVTARGHAPIRRAQLIHRRMEQHHIERSLRAMILFQQGFLDQTMAVADDNFAYAQTTGHVMSEVYALSQSSCITALHVGDTVRSEVFVGRFAELARAHSLSLAAGLARFYSGMLLNLRGDRAAGFATLRGAAEDLRSGQFALYFSLLLSHLAERLGEEGIFDEASATISEAFARGDATGDQWCLPEFFRVRGRLALLAGRLADAEQDLDRAVSIAHGKGALFWELRAARNLAELRRSQARAYEGRDLLSAVYDRFAEGFQSADLQAARRLLDTLAEEQ
jgi:predicted ATPase/DNA-binding winged helix-turn-helix (wHTH) protein